MDMLIVNKVPQAFDFDAVKERVEQTYDAEVAAVLPHSDELMALASSGIFTLLHPDHPVSVGLQRVVARLLQ